MPFCRTLASLFFASFSLTACIVVPEQTHQTESITRVYVNEHATNTQVEINRPQVIIVQPDESDYPGRPHPIRSNCHIQSNGLSMGPFPVVCN